MKQSPFTIIIISVNIFIVFFLVYKNSQIVELSFQKQNYEKTKALFLKEKDRLQQQLCLSQSKSSIKHFAKNELTMEKIKPKHIKMITSST